jgi:hypothetical protein
MNKLIDLIFFNTHDAEIAEAILTICVCVILFCGMVHGIGR